MQYAYTLTDTTLTIMGEDFVPRPIPRTHPNWDEIIAGLRAGGDIDDLLDLPAAVITFMEGAVVISDGVLYFNERVLDTRLTQRILAFMGANDQALARPLINFLNKVMENPSRRAVQGLYEWAEKAGLPITPDGDILAYKIIREDYLDLHSGTMDNSVGRTVSLPRNEVDEDPDVTCSYGLHVCSAAYLPSYGSFGDNRVVVCQVNPKDFVAVPRDYHTSKARVCEYVVVGELEPDKARAFFPDAYVYDGGFDSDELDLNLEDAEPGDRYLTRGGWTVTITTVDLSDAYPIKGYAKDGELFTWTYDGDWFLGDGDAGDDRDIVSRA